MSISVTPITPAIGAEISGVDLAALSGGNTWLLSMQAAWAGLPEPLKARLRGRRIKHDGTYNSGGYLRQGVTPTDDPHKAPGAWHPAVCIHPATGVPALYLGRRRNS